MAKKAAKKSAKSKAPKSSASKKKPEAKSKAAKKTDHGKAERASAKAAKPDKAAPKPAEKHAEKHHEKHPEKHAEKPAEKAATKAPPAPPADDKSGRKGITIVTPKPVRRPRQPSAPIQMPTGLGRLLDPKSPHRKPLIPSGPKAVAQRALGQHGGPDQEAPKPEAAKTPFNKKELEHFRALLVRKRAELAGDVQTMESEALRGESGSLSNMPSHLAEQGSDASEQSLSLDLAAADRKLIREIDDALSRISNGTYGVCELTGKPIKVERLEELPWARYSIEAARELERLAMRG